MNIFNYLFCTELWCIIGFKPEQIIMLFVIWDAILWRHGHAIAEYNL